MGNDVFGGNYVLAGKAVFVRSNRSKFGTDFAPPVGQNSLKIVGKYSENVQKIVRKKSVKSL